jgi:Lysylphosphatidylglycerol synthase TM region
MIVLNNRAIRWGAIALGLSVLAWLIERIGLATIRASLIAAGPRFGWVVAASMASTFTSAWPLRILIARDARPTLLGTVASRFAASGLNALFPLLGAGESSRLLWVRRDKWPDATAAIVIDRVLFALASALVLIVGAAAAISQPQVPRAFALVSVLTSVVLTVLSLGVIWLTGRGAVTRSLLVLYQRMTPVRSAAETKGDVGVNRSTFRATDVALKAVLAGPKRAMVFGLVLHIVGRAFNAAEVFAALHALHIHPTTPQILIMTAVPVALSTAGAFVPSQLGIQEGAQAAISAAFGWGPAVGLSMVLLQRVRQLALVPVTLLTMHFAHRDNADTQQFRTHENDG